MLPTYEDLMRPLLELALERGEVTMREARDVLAERHGLSADDVAERIPSGGSMWNGRVHWARTYLVKAGALDSPRRGVVRANESTRELVERAGRIDKSVLQELPSFRQWLEQSRQVRSPQTASPTTSEGLASSDERTPREQLDDAYETLRREVEEELLERVRIMDPGQFERLVVRLMTSLGYGGALGESEHLGGSGDGGVDGVIREDRLGLEMIYLQAKRWEHSVSRPEIQAFAGSLEGFRANKGVFITTSRFSREAHDYVGQISKRIVLIDGPQLASLMYETGLGVSVEHEIHLKSLDTDFFDVDLD